MLALKVERLPIAVVALFIGQDKLRHELGYLDQLLYKATPVSAQFVERHHEPVVDCG